MAKQVPARRIDNEPNQIGARLTRAILDMAGRIPATDERKSRGPDHRVRALAAAAANKAALAAGTLALPPGPLGWLTLLPELVAIWHIQRQMVADIAGAYGASADLTRSHMLYCLFRHAAAQALRDVGVQVGGRLLIQDVPLRVIERVAGKIGVGLSRRVAGNGIARWLPVIGALGVSAYAYYDTRQVARTAIALFHQQPNAGAETADEPAAARAGRAPSRSPTHPRSSGLH